MGSGSEISTVPFSSSVVFQCVLVPSENRTAIFFCPICDKGASYLASASERPGLKLKTLVGKDRDLGYFGRRLICVEGMTRPVHGLGKQIYNHRFHTGDSYTPAHALSVN